MRLWEREPVQFPDLKSVMLGATFLSTWEIASIAVRIPLPIAVLRPTDQTLDRRIQQIPITRRRLDEFCKRRECNQTDLCIGALPLNERQRRIFGGLDARGLDIGGAHAS